MKAKVIVHYVVEAVVDFTYGRLRNECAIAALPYIAKALEKAVLANYEGDAAHVIVFQRDAHEATEEEFLLSNEGKKFPAFHCPKDDPGMEVVPVLKPFENFAFRTSPVDKPYIFDPVTVRTLEDVHADYGHIDEIHFYGFLTGMCVTGAAIQARANFQDAEIYVHARGTADVDGALHEAALALMERNFINIVR